MGANEIQNFVIKIVRSLAQNCSNYVKNHPFHSSILLFLFVLYILFPPIFIILAYSLPVVAFSFLVHRVFVGMDRPKVKSVGTKSKRWKELQSRRSFRSLNRIRAPSQYNQSSFMYDSPGARQNAKETSDETYNNTSAEDNDVFSTIFNDDVVDKRALVEENPKEIQEVIVESVFGRVGSLFTNAASQPLMPVNHYRFYEGYRKSSFDNGKDIIEKSLDVSDDEEKRIEHVKKTVRWMDDEEKSLMDLGISEVERTKRLENLMARRRSRKPSSFQVRRNGMGIGGVGNNSCSQIPSLVIPKTNPFLADSSLDLTLPAPGSAPSYMVEQNPFDLPYDPHEEKPILTGDSFQEEFMSTHEKDPMLYRHERFSLGNFAPPFFTNCKHQTSLDSAFAIKQLTSSRMGISSVASKEDDIKQPQQDSLIPDDGIDDDNHAIEKLVDLVSMPDEAGENEAAEKVVEISDEACGTKDDHTKEQSSSSSSSSSSEDEPILRPNKEAILHCLSMSRMRVASQRNNFHRHAESFDCGPSALFDKTKTDSFFFGGNKRIHYGPTNSVASDMQVEVSDVGSPLSAKFSSLDEEVKGSLVNMSNPYEPDVNESRLRDMDHESNVQGAIEVGVSRQDPDLESTIKTEKAYEFKRPSLERGYIGGLPFSIPTSPKFMLWTEFSTNQSSDMYQGRKRSDQIDEDVDEVQESDNWSSTDEESLDQMELDDSSSPTVISDIDCMR